LGHERYIRKNIAGIESYRYRIVAAEGKECESGRFYRFGHRRTRETEMSVVTIPIAGRNYPMGCEDGQEKRLAMLGQELDLRARAILEKIGTLPENSLLATLCIVLIDEIQNMKRITPGNDSELLEVLSRLGEIKRKLSS
jgi:cell division protein ZapA